jgi:hypothetical protein
MSALSSDVDIGGFRFQELNKQNTVRQTIDDAEDWRTRFRLLELFTASQVLEQFTHLSALYLNSFSGGSWSRPSAGRTTWTAVFGARTCHEGLCMTP